MMGIHMMMMKEAVHPIIYDDDGFGDDDYDAEYNDNDNEEKKGSMCSVSHY